MKQKPEFASALLKETYSMANTGKNDLLVAILFFISIISLLISPGFMPDDYSRIANTTSESAAQGQVNAWIARLGFVTFGLAVLWQSSSSNMGWSTLIRLSHSLFGVSMVLVAAFSKKHWTEGAVFDPTEDMLHSIFATVMGFAFSVGVVFSLFRRKRDSWGKLLDVVAITSSVFIPLLMLNFKNIDGLIQRLMFGISYVWYLRELTFIKRSQHPL